MDVGRTTSDWAWRQARQPWPLQTEIVCFEGDDEHHARLARNYPRRAVPTVYGSIPNIYDSSLQLAPQVTLSKQVDLARDTEQALDAAPIRIVARWVEGGESQGCACAG